MENHFAIEDLDQTLKDIMENEISFGGKVMTLGGDFRQVMLVLTNGTTSQMINACLVRSPLWRSVTVLRLRQNMRTISDNPLQFSFCV